MIDRDYIKESLSVKALSEGGFLADVVFSLRLGINRELRARNPKLEEQIEHFTHGKKNHEHLKSLLISGVT